MYRWVLLIHIGSVLGFVLVHGASGMAAWRLRRERGLEPARALLELTMASTNLMYGLLVLLLASGIVLGFMGHWWGRGWIWAALVVLLAIVAAMSIFGHSYHEARRLAGTRYFDYRKVREMPPQPADAAGLAHELEAARPNLLIGIGVVGLLILLWLMLFKPL